MRSRSADRKLVDERRAHIAIRAAHLLVKKGFEQTNVQEIADACSISIGSLYNYIGKKEDVLYLIIDHGLSSVENVFEKFVQDTARLTPSDALKKAIKMRLELVEAKQDITVFCYQEMKNLQPSYLQRFTTMALKAISQIEDILKRGCEVGEFEISDTTIVAHDIAMIADNWALKRWFLRKHYSLQEYTDVQTKLIMQAITNKKSSHLAKK